MRAPIAWAAAAGLLLALSGCGQAAQPGVAEAEALAASMAQQHSAAGTPAASQTASDAPDGHSASATPEPTRTKKHKDPSPDSTPEAQPTTPGDRPAVDPSAQWASYPWGSDGLECSPPGDSPGVGLDPADPSLVVIMGDSLIRESRDAITSSLEGNGFTPVFVCWGGKTLEWGQQQVDTMRQLGVLPQCLVINLGTNDLKGTTAQGLADAVDVETVSARLQSLLGDLYDVPSVFVVNLAADLSLAPATMKRVKETQAVYQNAVDSTGVGAVIDFASQAQGGGLSGDDGVHDSAQGQAVRASLIADAVTRDCG